MTRRSPASTPKATLVGRLLPNVNVPAALISASLPVSSLNILCQSYRRKTCSSVFAVVSSSMVIRLPVDGVTWVANTSVGAFIGGMPWMCSRFVQLQCCFHLISSTSSATVTWTKMAASNTLASWVLRNGRNTICGRKNKLEMTVVRFNGRSLEMYCENCQSAE